MTDTRRHEQAELIHKLGMKAAVLAVLAAVGIGTGEVPSAARGSRRVSRTLLPQLGPKLKHYRQETYPGQAGAHLVGAWKGDGSVSVQTRQSRRTATRGKV